MFINKSKISRIKHFAIKITTLSGNADDEKNKIVVIQDHIFWVFEFACCEIEVVLRLLT